MLLHNLPFGQSGFGFGQPIFGQLGFGSPSPFNTTTLKVPKLCSFCKVFESFFFKTNFHSQDLLKLYFLFTLTEEAVAVSAVHQLLQNRCMILVEYICLSFFFVTFSLIEIFFY